MSCVACSRTPSSNAIVLDVSARKLGLLLNSEGFSDYLNFKFNDPILGSGTVLRYGDQLGIRLDSTQVLGSSELYLLADSLTIWMNETQRINSLPYELVVNSYLSIPIFLFPRLNADLLEVHGNRTDEVYNCDRILEFDMISRLDTLLLTDKSKENLLIVYNDTDYVPSRFFVNRNPLTNRFTLIPELEGLKEHVDYVEEEFTFSPCILERTVRDTIFYEGNVVLDSVILRNKYIIVREGTTLNLRVDTSYFFENCVLICDGKKDSPIYIEGNGGAIYVAGGQNHFLAHVKISNLGAFERTEIQLPSGLTFYNTNVEIENSVFSSNLSGDDFLNLYASSFALNNCEFTDILSDALDSDFSSGYVRNSSFNNIGNDGIDGSGSSIKIENVIFRNVSDKAISAGENSKFTAVKCVVNGSEMAFVAKDGSLLSIDSNNIVSNTTFTFVVFQKKDFYVRPKLYVDVDFANVQYLIEPEVDIINIHNSEPLRTKKVKDLLYGKVFGRKTIK